MRIDGLQDAEVMGTARENRSNFNLPIMHSYAS